MRTARSLTVSHCIWKNWKNHTCPPNNTMHAPPNKTMHTPQIKPHMAPPEQPCMPPQEQPHNPPEQPCMPPPEQPHMPPRGTMHTAPPRSNHACPPSNHACPPWATTHAPRATTHAPPVNRMTNWCKNITLPQTSFAGGKYVQHWLSTTNLSVPIATTLPSLSTQFVLFRNK